MKRNAALLKSKNAMERITRDKLFMDIAKLMSQRSTCKRAQVGAIIVSADNRIISSGYNGPLPNEPHCSEDTCDLSKGCTRAVHAEVNAIYAAVKHGISLDGSKIYCLYSPCMKCAEAIISAGITEVHYQLRYRDNLPLSRLEYNNILTVQHA